MESGNWQSCFLVGIRATEEIHVEATIDHSCLAMRQLLTGKVVSNALGGLQSIEMRA